MIPRGPSGDSRRLEESESISTRETLRIFGRTLRYVRPFRRGFAIKAGLTLLSLAPLLLLPWPAKVIIDHVLDGRPLAPALLGYPFFIRPLLTLCSGLDRIELLAVMLAIQASLVLLVGAMGSSGRERDQTNAWLASGHDTATRTENAANSGWSFSGGLLGWLDFRFTLRLTQALNHHYRSRLFDRIQSLPMSAFDEERIGDAVYRVMYDTPSITESAYRIVLTPVVVPIAILTFAAMLREIFGAHPALFWTALAFAPAAFAVTFPFSGLVRRTGDRSRKAGAQTTSTLEEGMANVLAVTSLGGEGRERARFDADSSSSFRRYRMFLVAGIVTFLAALIPALWVVREGFLYIVDQVIDGALTRGDFPVLFTYFTTILFLSIEPGALWIRLQNAAPGLQRVFFLMDLPNEGDPSRGRTLHGVHRAVRFEAVDFRYSEGPPALQQIEFEARRGEVTALVGPVGAGKTTLVYLIPRFLEPSAGRVRIDGVDTSELSLETLRANVAFVFQESQLFDGTIAENIRLGRPEASELELRRAAQIAGVEDFIHSLPLGYATPLGRAGAKLSVGQKQRMAIARALLREAPILILDEPTSALDPATERRLVAALREAARTRIVLVIAHRLSTIRSAEQILFLDGGRIVERGNHAALMASERGAYRRFVELQTRGRALDQRGA
ncbi:MAG: ABC transporter ATP-binding protein [Myxococcota bacterium]